MLQEGISRPGADQLTSILQQTEPRRCMVNLLGPCPDPPVRAHFIQKALLRNIENESHRVHPLYSFNVGDWGSGHVDSHVGLWFMREIYTKSAARREFVCQRHEELFREIENPKPDWNNPRHRTLLTYRTLMINSYVKQWTIDALSPIYGMESVASIQRRQLHPIVPFETAVRRALVDDAFEDIRHSVSVIDVPPVLAATGVMFVPPLGTIMFDRAEKRIIPVPSSPMAVSVLPETDGQVLLLTCMGGDVLNLHNLLKEVRYPSATVSTMTLSKKVLEELEFIFISPGAWNAVNRQGL